MKPLTFLVAGLVLASTSTAQEVPRLLFPAQSAPSAAFFARPEVRQASSVLIHADLVTSHAQAGARLSLGELAGEERIATFETLHEMPGGVVWSGRLEGLPESSVDISLVGDAVAASLRFEDNLLRIEPDAARPGTHVLTWLDEDRFDACGMGPEHAIHVDAEAIGGSGGAGTYGSGGLVADVLVVYSPQARSAQGGTNGILSLINLAVTETNQAYENSEVELRLNLAGTLETSQAETSDMGQVLGRLRNTGDGWYDEVHAERELLGADFVAMIVQSGGYCGIAYLMTNVSNGFKSSAFSVTKRSCATGYYSFGHEIGHNMGCTHDRDNAGGGAYAYSFGYRTPNNQYRTIMAYSPGNRIRYFSNPDVTFNGFPLGIAHPDPDSADNGRGIDTAAPTFTDWYGCPQPEVYGIGSVTSQGYELRLDYSGTPLPDGSGNFQLDVTDGVPGQFGMVFYGAVTTNTPFLGGFLYVGQPFVRMPPQQVDAQGNASFDWISFAQPSSGETYVTQFWVRDPVGNPNGETSALSNAVSVRICNQ